MTDKKSDIILEVIISVAVTAFIILLILCCVSGCSVSGGFAAHDRSLDSEYKEDAILGWFQGDINLNENISLYARHESMPRFDESKNGRGGGYGVNSFGIAGKIKLFE